MDHILDDITQRMNTASDQELKSLFVQYCLRLVALKEEGQLIEEEAAYRIVGAFLKFEKLADYPECEEIFDAAGTAEISRLSSYRQPMGAWNEKIADEMKQKEWKELVVSIENAKRSLEI